MAPADAIVVVGAPLRSDGTLSDIAIERVRAGVALWQNGLAPILCFAGGGAGRLAPEQPREADVMAELARSLGVPDRALRIERESRSTAENARLAAALLRAEGCRRVWLVSQPFHTRRARLWFRRAGLEVVLAWYDPDSLQFRDPQRALVWIAREYVAWARMLAWDVRAVISARSR
jgi:uncharacterized SAM-binding protein YcdF (DUF218 family)